MNKKRNLRIKQNNEQDKETRSSLIDARFHLVRVTSNLLNAQENCRQPKHLKRVQGLITLCENARLSADKLIEELKK